MVSDTFWWRNSNMNEKITEIMIYKNMKFKIS